MASKKLLLTITTPMWQWLEAAAAARDATMQEVVRDLIRERIWAEQRSNGGTAQ